MDWQLPPNIQSMLSGLQGHVFDPAFVAQQSRTAFPGVDAFQAQAQQPSPAGQVAAMPPMAGGGAAAPAPLNRGIAAPAPLNPVHAKPHQVHQPTVAAPEMPNMAGGGDKAAAEEALDETLKGGMFKKLVAAARGMQSPVGGGVPGLGGSIQGMFGGGGAPSAPRVPRPGGGGGVPMPSMPGLRGLFG